MRAWILFFPAAAMVLWGAGCGADGCDDDECAGTPAASCRTICEGIDSCLAGSMEEDAFDRAGCVSDCVERLDASQLPTCAACVSAVACDLADRCMDSDICDPARYDLAVAGSGFGAWDGAAVFVAVMEFEDDDYRYQENVARTTIDAGGFKLEIPAVLRAAEAFALDVLVDVDANYACDPNDFTFRHPLGRISSPVRATIRPPSTTDGDLCDWYTTDPTPRLFVKASGFEGSNGKWVMLSLVNESVPAFDRDYRIARVMDGGFEARFNWTFGNDELRIVWAIDDGDWTCGDSDTGGFVMVGRIEGDRHVSITPAASAPGFCDELREF